MTTETQDNETLILEMQARAQTAKEPGTLGTKDVVHKGDGDLPAPMVISQLQSAGYVYVYDTKTGERSLVNRNMLPSQLKKKHEDGSYAFTTVKPAIVPRRGTLKCSLHPDDPNFKRYLELGFPTCKKANLTNPFQVKRHMQKRHPLEYQSLEDERLEKERQDDRELRTAILGKALNPTVHKTIVDDVATERVVHHRKKKRKYTRKTSLG